GLAQSATLDAVATLARAKAGGLDREARRLKRRLGADDPRTRRAVRRRAEQETFQRAVAAEQERSSAPIPDPVRGAGVIYGQVRAPASWEGRTLVIEAASGDGRRVLASRTVAPNGRYCVEVKTRTPIDVAIRARDTATGSIVADAGVVRMRGG